MGEHRVFFCLTGHEQYPLGYFLSGCDKSGCMGTCENYAASCLLFATIVRTFCSALHLAVRGPKLVFYGTFLTDHSYLLHADLATFSA